MSPHWGNTILFRSSQQLPRRAFWADTAPFKGPRLASCVASGTTEIQGHRHVCCARRGGPRTPSTTIDANLDCAFVENALFNTDPWLWKANRIELSLWPYLYPPNHTYVILVCCQSCWGCCKSGIQPGKGCHGLALERKVCWSAELTLGLCFGFVFLKRKAENQRFQTCLTFAFVCHGACMGACEPCFVY